MRTYRGRCVWGIVEVNESNEGYGRTPRQVRWWLTGAIVAIVQISLVRPVEGMRRSGGGGEARALCAGSRGGCVCDALSRRWVIRGGTVVSHYNHAQWCDIYGDELVFTPGVAKKASREGASKNHCQKLQEVWRVSKCLVCSMVPQAVGVAFGRPSGHQGTSPSVSPWF